MKPQNPISTTRAFTLVELLVVIAIVGILAGLSGVAFTKVKEKAHFVNHVANVKNITMHTLRWAADNSQTLPSPQYPGGHHEEDPAIPEHWDFAGTGSGLWLDGVVYYAAMFEMHNQRAGEEGGEEEMVNGVDGENGKHLEGTIFLSEQSLRKDPDLEDLHMHSYAMNKTLQYDFIYAKTDDAELTNKNLARITHRPSALLYIENQDSNVVGFQDREAIIETGKRRWSSQKIISSYLDGSTRALSAKDIPSQSLTEDLQSSRFWRGVDADAFTGE